MVSIALLLLVPSLKKTAGRVKFDSGSKPLSSRMKSPLRYTQEDVYLDNGRVEFDSGSKPLSSRMEIPLRHTEEDVYLEISSRLLEDDLLLDANLPTNLKRNVLKSSSFDKRGTAFRRKIRTFLKAGVVDAQRKSHSIFGSLSILVGFHHMVDIIIINSFVEALTVPTIISTGMLHTLVGTFGIRRLNFKNKMESARNAMFWPAPIQSFWLTSISLTEWGQGSDALISMWSAPFMMFTAMNLALTFWQLSEILQKTGNPTRTKDTIWFKDAATNAILVEFSYLIWMQIQMGAALYIASTAQLDSFSNYMDTFPQMQYLLGNAALNTAFFNNLAIFIATLLRYKIVSKPNLDNTIVFAVPLLSSIVVVWKVLSCFFLIEDGEMSASFFSVVF